MGYNSAKLRKQPDPSAVWIDEWFGPSGTLPYKIYPTDADMRFHCESPGGLNYFLELEQKAPGERVSGGQGWMHKGLMTLPRYTVCVLHVEDEPLESNPWQTHFVPLALHCLNTDKWYERAGMRAYIHWWIENVKSGAADKYAVSEGQSHG